MVFGEFRTVLTFKNEKTAQIFFFLIYNILKKKILFKRFFVILNDYFGVLSGLYQSEGVYAANTRLK